MKNKIMILWIIMFIIGLIYSPIVSATKMELKTERQEIKAGEEIDIEIKVKDIDIENGINSIQGQFIYNKEDWKINNVEGKNNWSIVYNEEEGKSKGKFVLINFGKETKEEEVIAKITLKARNKITNTKTELKVIDSYTTDGEEMIQLEEASEIIKIKANMSFILVIAIVAILFTVVITILLYKKHKK